MTCTPSILLRRYRAFYANTNKHLPERAANLEIDNWLTHGDTFTLMVFQKVILSDSNTSSLLDFSLFSSTCRKLHNKNFVKILKV